LIETATVDGATLVRYAESAAQGCGMDACVAYPDS
jgi:hypothetical protein